MLSRRALLVITVFLLTACGTNSTFDFVWPTKTEEFYRAEGVVCEEASDMEQGGLFLGVSFMFAKTGGECNCEVFVPAGLSGMIKEARKLQLNNRVAVIGSVVDGDGLKIHATKIVGGSI